jgi:energy-coupling factor transporter ATP-binding protein EcfA2
MLEWLATVTAAEISKVLLEQVLKLSQAAAADYVKDFLKDSLKEGIALVQPGVAQQAVATALKEFCTLVQDELLTCHVPPVMIRERYDAPLRQFLKDPRVKPLLGQAFDSQCQQINAAELARIWRESWLRDQPFPLMPVGFNWQEIAAQYLKEVNRIRKATPELRALLEVELQEVSLATQQAIQRQIIGISPGFDLAAYRASLQSSYGYLKLNTLDVNSDHYRIKLGKLFVEPTVREALPPLRFELPTDLRQSLRQYPELHPIQLEHLAAPYQQSYWQKPAQPVLRALRQASRLVILGDPGAGKSTLLQYLAIAWVEGRTTKLPLLIELREYLTEILPTHSLLDFLHAGQMADWQFDRYQLRDYLKQYPSRIMLDGLDEVLDATRRRAVLDEIARFGQQYPKAQIIVTSRLVDYHPERLRDAGFRHFTMQPLEPEQIRVFIERWYDLTLDVDQTRLKQRLQAAIEQSAAIQSLAENPLLLTMMAILNRSKPLPSYRTQLYKDAAAVLLHDWDVNYKQLQLPFDALDASDKQALLGRIAYEMQAANQLAANLIEAEALKQIITRYLQKLDFAEPYQKAGELIRQLHQRNFMLCYRGENYYSFVHRTFLEYFCAAEFVYRFEKQKTLSFEQLRDEGFGSHWADESWHEVLRLIAGLLDDSFTEQLMQFLIDLPVDRSQFLEAQPDFWLDAQPLKQAGLSNLLLAASCLAEMRHRHSPVAERLLHLLQQEIEQPMIPLSYEAVAALLSTIATAWAGNPAVLDWLKRCLDHSNPYVPFYSVSAIAQGWQAEPDTLIWLKTCLDHSSSLVQQAAVLAIAQGWRRDPETLPLLTSCVKHPNSLLRWAALQAMAQGWRQTETMLLLKTTAQQDPSSFVRQAAVEALAQDWLTNTEVVKLLYWVARHDLFERVEDWQLNPRLTALQALIRNYSAYPRIQQLLNYALQDEDEQVREWAQSQNLRSAED